MKRELMIAGFSAVSVLAVTGWIRPDVTPVQAFAPPAAQSEAAVVRVAQASAPARRVRAAAPVYARRENYEQREYREPRSTAKSAAIIAGSAAGGAAVGALAGGGKGAAMGAIAGGAGGYVYDRVTRDRQAQITRERSTAEKAAVIGGGAATGAAIGGLAGGGKGALIGAAAGGVGGYIFDRVTR